MNDKSIRFFCHRLLETNLTRYILMSSWNLLTNRHSEWNLLIIRYYLHPPSLFEKHNIFPQYCVTGTSDFTVVRACNFSTKFFCVRRRKTASEKEWRRIFYLENRRYDCIEVSVKPIPKSKPPLRVQSTLSPAVVISKYSSHHFIVLLLHQIPARFPFHRSL